MLLGLAVFHRAISRFRAAVQLLALQATSVYAAVAVLKVDPSSLWPATVRLSLRLAALCVSTAGGPLVKVLLGVVTCRSRAAAARTEWLGASSFE